MIRPKELAVEEEARGMVSVEVLLDPPPLPAAKQRRRDRRLGLRVHRLEQPAREKQPQQRRGRDAKGGDRDDEVQGSVTPRYVQSGPVSS